MDKPIAETEDKRDEELWLKFQEYYYSLDNPGDPLEVLEYYMRYVVNPTIIPTPKGK